MYFDGCALPLGCTVLLRGASAAELTKLKRVVKFGVLAAYHLSLEVNFLSEELALTTAALAAPGESAADMPTGRTQNFRCFVLWI
jgi:1-phosphatidylinositol-3-phosphate 5-kinase